MKELMKAVMTPIEGLILMEQSVFADDRGFFLELYQRDQYADVGIVEEFVQDNHSHSLNGVIRGLHFQMRRPQSQIVTVISGAIFDVCVDLRRKSKTFGKWHAVTLSDAGQRQLYMAPGLAHGFCVLSDRADLHYKVSQIYDPSDECGLVWNDHDVGIKWPINNPNVSGRDAQFRRLKDLSDQQLPNL